MSDIEKNPWRFTGARRLFENRWIALEALEGTAPNGGQADYTVVRFRKHAVGVLPIEADGMVHLVGQWRAPLGAYSWEMPEGGAEPGESLEACALRECEEEVGVRCGRLIKVLEMDLSNSVTDEAATCFVAFDLTPCPPRPDPTEVLQRRRLPFLEALGMAANGRVRDSMTVATLLRVHHMAQMRAFSPEITAALLQRGAGSACDGG
jgi:8-oxo-dGTP pyrophosphatase MutT (NUDIX family)